MTIHLTLNPHCPTGWLWLIAILPTGETILLAEIP